MSQFRHDLYTPARQTNSLGLAGFICSLVGLFTGGLLSPIGLILSLIGLGRRPRGFAVAGTILGFLGTCGGILLFVLFAGAILAVLGIGVFAAFLALNDPQRMELTIDMANISEAVEKTKADTGYLPATLSAAGLSGDTLMDPWGHAYLYHFETGKTGFDVISAGPDGKEGSADDIKLSQLDKLWNNYIQVKTDQKSGKMTFRVGDKEVNLEGGHDGGKVKIRTDGRTIELSGGEDGGHINVVESGTHGDSESATQPAATQNEAGSHPN